MNLKENIKMKFDKKMRIKNTSCHLFILKKKKIFGGSNVYE